MDTQKWYERKWLVFALCVIFFPVGLYGLYKSQSIEKPTKYVIYGIFTVIILIQPFMNKEVEEVTKTESKTILAEDSLATIEKIERDRQQQPTECYLIARRTLKDNLNDKDSYDEDTHEENFVNRKNKKDPYILVKIRYRAKNGFGAMMLQETVFYFDESLSMIKSFNNQ